MNSQPRKPASKCLPLIAVWFALDGCCVASAAERPQVFTSPFADATVFRDRNGNGDLDPGEKQTKSRSDGRFDVPRGKGRLLLVGGLEIATGKANTRLIVLPAQARAASTLSALWQSLLDRGSSKRRNRRLLKLPAGTSIRNFKAVPVESTTPGSQEEALLKRDAELDVLVSFSKSLSAARIGLTARSADRFAAYSAAQEDPEIGALADTLLIDLKQAEVDLADLATITDVLGIIYRRLAVSVPPENLAIIASAANSIIGQIELSGAPLAKIQRIRGNAELVIAQRDYALLNARYTGYALEQQVLGDVYDPSAVVTPAPAGTPGLVPALNDTGIRACSDGIANDLPCPVAGYSGQDAELGRDVTASDDSDGHAGFSFTKLGADGSALPLDARAWDCVRDNVTGLVWEVKTSDGGMRDVFRGYTTYSEDYDPNSRQGSEGDAGGFVLAVNKLGLCGAHDWRLPSVEELESLLDLSIGARGPAIDARFLGATRTDYGYSTSSAYAPAAAAVWTVRFDNGQVLAEPRDGALSPIRLVRGAP